MPSKHLDGTTFTGEEYKAVLASRREEAVNELKEQQTGRVPIEDGIAGVVAPTDDAVTDAALVVGYGFVAALDSVDMALDMESLPQRDSQPPSPNDDGTFGDFYLANDAPRDPFA